MFQVKIYSAVVRDFDGNLMVDRMVQHVYTIEDNSIGQMDIQEL